MGLKKLIVRRILLSVPVAIGVVTVIFLVMSAMTPTMKVAYYLGERPAALKPDNVKKAIHDFGLDQSLPLQYLGWLKKIVSFDFGRSYASQGEEGPLVLDLILGSFPQTFELILYSMPLVLMISIWLGTKAAFNQNRTLDHLARVVATMGTSFPVFVVSMFLIMLWLIVQNQFHFNFLPMGALDYNMQIDVNSRIAHGSFTVYTNMITIDTLLNGDTTLFLDSVMHIMLPVAVLVFSQCALLIRVTRSGLIEELGKPYAVSAIAKGLSEKEVLYKHVRKNASISVLTISGLLMSSMFVNIVIVERVFERPGFASLLIDSALTMNTPVLFAGAMFIALAFVVLNLAVDILYERLDPRIRLT
jgi:peptide/nickel transport system permease protein